MAAPFGPARDVRPLTRGEVEAELSKIDLRPQAGIVRRAEQMAGDYHGEGRDLLQEALARALATRSCPEGITGERFIAGIMRSIASTARRARERRGEDVVSLPVELVAERMALGGYTVQAADEIIESERIRRLCEDILERLAGMSAHQAALIEGIGLGLRGQVLADHLGIDAADLATVRRALKRNAQRLWPAVAAEIDGDGGLSGRS